MRSRDFERLATAQKSASENNRVVDPNMIPKRTAGTTSPPRSEGKLFRKEFTLTASSSDGGSSTNSSPNSHDERVASISGYRASTLTARVRASQPYSSSTRRRRQTDVSILRGAALVRENLVSKLAEADTKMEIPSQKGSFDSDEWSDPWDEKRQEGWNASTDEQQLVRQTVFEESSGLDDSFSSPPSLNEEIHWASMALVPRDEEAFYNPQAYGSDRVPDSSFGNLNYRNTMHHLPALFDSSDSSEATLSTIRQKETNCLDSMFDHRDAPSAPRQHSPGSPTTSEDDTHMSTMGRGRSIRMKVVKYNVLSLHDNGDDTTFDGSYESVFEDLSIVPDPIETRPTNPTLDTPAHKIVKYEPTPSLQSPLSKHYEMVQQDDGFHHAQQAGYLWQSLVGHHVRFPKHWFEGLRAPPMGSDSPWRYVARLAVRGNPILNKLVRTRSSPGRLLLHFIVRDLLTGMAVFDLAIGCFHPNAKAVRTMKRPDPKDEKCRHVWMSIRKVTGAVTLLDNVLCRGKTLDEVAKGSPLGDNRRDVTNLNMRSVFGEEPPIRTICIQESELYQKLASASELTPSIAKAPALLLLQEFLVLP